MFGSKPNKLSKPIEGAAWRLRVSVDNFINPAPLTNAVREKRTDRPGYCSAFTRQIFDALKDKANVKDYRAKFL